MSNCMPATNDEKTAGDDGASAAGTAEGNCSGHGKGGCCGNHHQEVPSTQNQEPEEGCCGGH